ARSIPSPFRPLFTVSICCLIAGHCLPCRALGGCSNGDALLRRRASFAPR
uniref:Uncharacterized protein n=1 Tax=Aegilops tauschii subsp. strangulata TaxID=200361 RepID=A0A453G678_AEGTS